MRSHTIFVSSTSLSNVHFSNMIGNKSPSGENLKKLTLCCRNWS